MINNDGGESVPSREQLRESVFSDEELCNEVIERYLSELARSECVPVVKGYSALCALPKPKTLEDAKKLVDGG